MKKKKDRMEKTSETTIINIQQRIEISLKEPDFKKRKQQTTTRTVTSARPQGQAFESNLLGEHLRIRNFNKLP